MRLAGLACVLALASTASADPTADQLRAEGEAHGKRGEYAEAIQSFKDADKTQPQPVFACMIGLTYLRRNLLAQAELFFDRCHTRARGEKLPSWVAGSEKQLAKAIADGKFSTVVITATPPTAAPLVRISGFAPDETFDPRTIHMPEGAYTVSATAPGYADLAIEIVVRGDHGTQNVELAFEPGPPPPPIDPTPVEKPIEKPVVVEPPPVPPKPVDPMTRPPGPFLSEGMDPRRKVAIVLAITGGTLALGGGVMHYVTWQKGNDLSDTKVRADYNRLGDQFDRDKVITLGLYGAAAIALGASLYFHLTAPESSPSIAAFPVAGGGMFTIGWQR